MTGRRGRRQQRGWRPRIGMGDVVWGIIIGVLAIGAVVAFVVGFRQGSGGGTSCDQQLPPLGQSPIEATEFQAADQGLTATAEAARMGNLLAAQNAFFGRVHNFTHNVDPPVRAKDHNLAKTLCEHVFNLEREFAIDQRTQQIALEADSIRQILIQAAQVLGIPPPQ